MSFVVRLPADFGLAWSAVVAWNIVAVGASIAMACWCAYLAVKRRSEMAIVAAVSLCFGLWIGGLYVPISLALGGIVVLSQRRRSSEMATVTDVMEVEQGAC